MEDETSQNRLVGKIKGIGDGVTGAAKTLTGQSTADEIAEFSDAFTDALKLMDSDIQSLRRRMASVELAVEENKNSESMTEVPVAPQVGRSYSGATAVSMVAIAIAVVALVLAVIR